VIDGVRQLDLATAFSADAVIDFEQLPDPDQRVSASWS
jgi:hypothetical protein